MNSVTRNWRNHGLNIWVHFLLRIHTFQLWKFDIDYANNVKETKKIGFKLCNCISINISGLKISLNPRDLCAFWSNWLHNIKSVHIRQNLRATCILVLMEHYGMSIYLFQCHWKLCFSLSLSLSQISFKIQCKMHFLWKLKIVTVVQIKDDCT